MAALRVRPIGGALACLALFLLLSASSVLAQTVPPTAAPATLRLAQVVPRLPKIHLYAIAQDENGKSVALQPGELSALVGSTNASVEISQEREGIGIVFLIDISASLNRSQFNIITYSVKKWIEALEDPLDRAAIVTLGSSVRTVQDFTANKKALKDAVDQLAPRDQNTLLYQGLVQAIDLSRRLDNSLPIRRAIVVLTDGLDDQQGGAGRKEVLDKLEVDPTPIYGIGASGQKNSEVDAALKDFSALVRASGGDFRRADFGVAEQRYKELRDIVDATKHLTATCDDPLCAPDGSAIVVRLLLAQGGARLSSESVTVRAVGTEGEVIKPEPHGGPIILPKNSPGKGSGPLSSSGEPPSSPGEPPSSPGEPPSSSGGPPSIWKIIFEFLRNVHLQWWLPLAVAAVGFTAGIVFFVRRANEKKRTPQPPPKVTSQEPEIMGLQAIGVDISARVAIPSGTQQDKQRLRLYPIGRNDLNPIDVLFEDTLAVGRSPDSDICISNDGQVSASHCALSPKGKSILVQDARSHNGTRVNGVPIKGFLHAEPDSILGVGRTELRMKLLPSDAR